MLTINGTSNNCIQNNYLKSKVQFEEKDYQNALFSSNEDDLQVMVQNKPSGIYDKREEKNIFQKIGNFFKYLFKKPEYKIYESGDNTIIKHNLEKGGTFVQTVNHYSDEEYDINGKLDATIKQGQMEDCGLIGLCVSLAQSEEGQKIISDSISINYDENNEPKSYDVHFKGLGETYTITNEELDEAYKKEVDFYIDKSEYFYAQGDKDMVLLELAWSKCFSASDKVNEFGNKNILRPKNLDMPVGLSNVDQSKLYYALTGNNFNEAGSQEAKDYFSNIEDKREQHIENIINEKQEFKFSDLIENPNQSCMTKDGKTGEIIFELNKNDTYEIIKTPEDTKDGTFVYKNKTTNNIYQCKKTSFINSVSSYKTQENKEEMFNIEYKNLKNSDVRLINTHYSFTLEDVNANSHTMTSLHVYSIKSVDEDSVEIINPHDTSVVIDVPKDELKKNAGAFKFSYGDLN